MRVLQETELSCPERDATSPTASCGSTSGAGACGCGERAPATAMRSMTSAILVGYRARNVVRCGERRRACPQRKPRSWSLLDRPQAASLRANEVWPLACMHGCLSRPTAADTA
jgi:hypothetical protein